MQLMELAAHVLLVSIIPHTASSYRNWTSVSLSTDRKVGELGE